MPKIFLVVISLQILMCLSSAPASIVGAQANPEDSSLSVPSQNSFAAYLQKMHPFLRRQRLTKSMKSLLRSLKRRRKKRNYAFIVNKPTLAKPSTELPLNDFPQPPDSFNQAPLNLTAKLPAVEPQFNPQVDNIKVTSPPESLRGADQQKLKSTTLNSPSGLNGKSELHLSLTFRPSNSKHKKVVRRAASEEKGSADVLASKLSKIRELLYGDASSSTAPPQKKLAKQNIIEVLGHSNDVSNDELVLPTTSSSLMLILKKFPALTLESTSEESTSEVEPLLHYALVSRSPHKSKSHLLTLPTPRKPLEPNSSFASLQYYDIPSTKNPSNVTTPSTCKTPVTNSPTLPAHSPSPNLSVAHNTNLTHLPDSNSNLQLTVANSLEAKSNNSTPAQTLPDFLTPSLPKTKSSGPPSTFVRNTPNFPSPYSFLSSSINLVEPNLSPQYLPNLAAPKLLNQNWPSTPLALQSPNNVKAFNSHDPPPPVGPTPISSGFWSSLPPIALNLREPNSPYSPIPNSYNFVAAKPSNVPLSNLRFLNAPARLPNVLVQSAPNLQVPNVINAQPMYLPANLFVPNAPNLQLVNPPSSSNLLSPYKVSDPNSQNFPTPNSPNLETFNSNRLLQSNSSYSPLSNLPNSFGPIGYDVRSSHLSEPKCFLKPNVPNVPVVNTDNLAAVLSNRPNVPVLSSLDLAIPNKPNPPTVESDRLSAPIAYNLPLNSPNAQNIFADLPARKPLVIKPCNGAASSIPHSQPIKPYKSLPKVLSSLDLAIPNKPNPPTVESDRLSAPIAYNLPLNSPNAQNIFADLPARKPLVIKPCNGAASSIPHSQPIKPYKSLPKVLSSLDLAIPNKPNPPTVESDRLSAPIAYNLPLNSPNAQNIFADLPARKPLVIKPCNGAASSIPHSQPIKPYKSLPKVLSSLDLAIPNKPNPPTVESDRLSAPIAYNLPLNSPNAQNIFDDLLTRKPLVIKPCNGAASSISHSQPIKPYKSLPKVVNIPTVKPPSLNNQASSSKLLDSLLLLPHHKNVLRQNNCLSDADSLQDKAYKSADDILDELECTPLESLEDNTPELPFLGNLMPTPINTDATWLPEFDSSSDVALLDDQNDGQKPNSSHTSGVLGEILENIKELQRLQTPRDREELACNVNGSWLSSAGGAILTIKLKKPTLDVCLSSKSPASKHGFLIHYKDWRLNGSAPFSKLNRLILTGINSKTKDIIAFVGECRVCGGIDMVSGNWLVERLSRSCNDQRASVEVIADMWRKEELSTLRKVRWQNLQKLKISRTRKHSTSTSTSRPTSKPTSRLTSTATSSSTTTCSSCLSNSHVASTHTTIRSKKRHKKGKRFEKKTAVVSSSATTTSSKRMSIKSHWPRRRYINFENPDEW